MKFVFAPLLLAVLFTSSVGHTEPNPAVLKANFYNCIKNDSSWYARWGYWVAAFNRKEAYRFCRSYDPQFSIRMTGCEINEEWMNAGYTCEY